MRGSDRRTHLADAESEAEELPSWLRPWLQAQGPGLDAQTGLWPCARRRREPALPPPGVSAPFPVGEAPGAVPGYTQLLRGEAGWSQVSAERGPGSGSARTACRLLPPENAPET